MTAPFTGTGPLERIAPDALDTGLLAVTRHFLTTLADPASQSWHLAFGIASERWGAVDGPRIAMALFAVLQALGKARPVPFRHCDPLDPEARGRVTPEETALLRMIRAMTRDLTEDARHQVAALTGGRMDPALIRAGLALARILPRPAAHPVMLARHRGLSLVH